MNPKLPLLIFNILLLIAFFVQILLKQSKQRFITGPPEPRMYSDPVGPTPRPFFFYDFGGVYSGGNWPSRFNYPTYTKTYPNSVCNKECKCGTPYPCNGPCPADFSCDLTASTFNYYNK